MGPHEAHKLAQEAHNYYLNTHKNKCKIVSIVV